MAGEAAWPPWPICTLPVKVAALALEFQSVAATNWTELAAVGAPLRTRLPVMPVLPLRSTQPEPVAVRLPEAVAFSGWLSVMVVAVRPVMTDPAVMPVPDTGVPRTRPEVEPTDKVFEPAVPVMARAFGRAESPLTKVKPEGSALAEFRTRAPWPMLRLPVKAEEPPR